MLRIDLIAMKMTAFRSSRSREKPPFLSRGKRVALVVCGCRSGGAMGGAERGWKGLGFLHPRAFFFFCGACISPEVFTKIGGCDHMRERGICVGRRGLDAHGGSWVGVREGRRKKESRTASTRVCPTIARWFPVASRVMPRKSVGAKVFFFFSRAEDSFLNLLCV